MKTCGLVSFCCQQTFGSLVCPFVSSLKNVWFGSVRRFVSSLKHVLFAFILSVSFGFARRCFVSSMTSVLGRKCFVSSVTFGFDRRCLVLSVTFGFDRMFHFVRDVSFRWQMFSFVARKPLVLFCFVVNVLFRSFAVPFCRFVLPLKIVWFCSPFVSFPFVLFSARLAARQNGFCIQTRWPLCPQKTEVAIAPLANPPATLLTYYLSTGPAGPFAHSTDRPPPS